MAVLPVWLGQLGARLPASTISHVLLGGLVASRFGLWLFDLSVSQMLQEWIPDEDIGEHAKTIQQTCLDGIAAYWTSISELFCALLSHSLCVQVLHCKLPMVKKYSD